MKQSPKEALIKFLFSKRYEILLFIIVFFGYFPVSSFIFPVKFGAIYFHYPWRYEIVEMIRSGALPLWYYFHHSGVPLYADPQSGAWYPLVWFFALLGRYSLYHFQLEYLIHIYIAAFGMYFFGNTLKLSKFSSLFVAVAYVFSGIFSDNVLTSWTISMAWIPLVAAFVVLLSEKPGLKNILGLSLSLSMLILGGYPAFTIVLAYLIAIYVFIQFFIKLKVQKRMAVKFLLSNIYAAIFSLLITSVLLFSVFVSLEYMVRTQALDLSYANTGYLDIKSFISMVLPFATVTTGHNIIPELDTWFTMANSYFGIITLILLVVSPFVLKKNKSYLVFLLTGFVFLIYSLGNQGFIFKIFHDYLPGFALFRYINFVRVFFIIAFLLVAGMTLDKLFEKNDFGIFKKTSFIFALLFLTLFFFLLPGALSHFRFHDFEDLLKNISLFQRMAIQSLWQFLLLAFLFIILKYSSLNKNKVLLVFLLADMIFSFNLNFLYTGYAIKTTVKQANNLVENNRHPLDLENNMNLWQNSKTKKYYLFDFGLNEYEGRVSTHGNGSFQTRRYRNLMLKHPYLAKRILSKPLASFSNLPALFPDDSLKNYNSVIYLDRISYEKYKNSCRALQKKGRIISSDFQKNQMEFQTEGGGFFTVLQNWYPGWNAYIDGKKQKIIISNGSFMSIFVEPGIHKIDFVYKPRGVRFAFWLSAISFVVAIFVYFGLLIFKSKGS